MAQVTVEGNTLVVEIEGLDKLWTFKSRLDIPLANVRGATADPGIVKDPKGVRTPGAHIPGVIAAGERYARLVVQVADPRATRDAHRAGPRRSLTARRAARRPARTETVPPRRRGGTIVIGAPEAIGRAGRTTRCGSLPGPAVGHRQRDRQRHRAVGAGLGGRRQLLLDGSPRWRRSWRIRRTVHPWRSHQFSCGYCGFHRFCRGSPRPGDH